MSRAGFGRAEAEGERKVESMPMNPENDPTPITHQEFFWQDFMPLFAMMQSRVLANQFVLVEILKDLAGREKEPRTYLSKMYDRVMGRFEQRPFDPDHPIQEVNFRQAVEAVIMKAGDKL